jgi:hypothetical protein
MKYKIIEIEDSEKNVVAHHIQNSRNKTVSILEEELGDDSISEAFQIDEDFIEARYSDYDTSEFSALFSPDGGLIKKGICELTYISDTNDFIISTNVNGDSACYEYTTDHEKDLYGVINSSGDYVLNPEWDFIEYSEVYGCYICDEKTYYIDDDRIGSLVVDLDEAVILKNGDSFILLSQDKSFSDGYDWLSENPIELPSGSNAIIAKKKGKFGIIDLSNKVIVDFVYDKINSESFVNPFKEEVANTDEMLFIAKLGEKFIVNRIANDDSVSEYFNCRGKDCKIIAVNFDEAPILIEFHHNNFSLYKLLDKAESISDGHLNRENESDILFAIFAINGKYGILDNISSSPPLLPFIYDSIETVFFKELRNLNRAGFLVSIIDENIFEIVGYDNRTGKFRSIIKGNNKEQTVESFKKLIFDSITLYKVE